jgi:hypothetical protein
MIFLGAESGLAEHFEHAKMELLSLVAVTEVVIHELFLLLSLQEMLLEAFLLKFSPYCLEDVVKMLTESWGH